MTSATHASRRRAVLPPFDQPFADECLACFVYRVLAVHGCDGGLRWTMRWRDARAPRATALASRLASASATCDCRVVFTAYRVVARLRELHGGSPATLPPCQRVRQGSAHPCSHWERTRGGTD
ncbi:DUF2695 domain-containing protein [Arsenicicoccus piscis]|uniref:DUF2695 domain-containing protein n=1 Tax=Arsenicicoccus piscis TaxID=673954 RepID=A0ABQ6HML5_9MICO|nr:DUF2695 domain-containing protein [Arsenicicoccus piscis]MCH8629023.1 DUF2695 domain-containing protein [Arsenicicoccus piscis]GMA19641.1 hypothetical protein GCM10025862_16620 [Arsenicicoccus piscis]